MAKGHLNNKVLREREKKMLEVEKFLSDLRGEALE